MAAMAARADSSVPQYGTSTPTRSLATSDDQHEYFTASSSNSTPTTHSSPEAGTSPAVTTVDPADWPLSRVLQWLNEHNFGNEWSETFMAHKIEKTAFLEIANYQKLKRLGLSENPGRFIRLVRSLDGSQSPSTRLGNNISANTSQNAGNTSRELDAKPSPQSQHPMPSKTNSSHQSTSSESSASAMPYSVRRVSLEKYLFLDERLRPTRTRPPGPFLMATLDNLVYTMVNITDAANAKQVRDKIVETLGLHSTKLSSVHLTDYFCVPGEPLNDMNLWSILSAAAGDIVKFFISVEQPSPSPGQTSTTDDEFGSPGGSRGNYPQTPTYLINNHTQASDYFAARSPTVTNPALAQHVQMIHQNFRTILPLTSPDLPPQGPPGRPFPRSSRQNDLSRQVNNPTNVPSLVINNDEQRDSFRVIPPPKNEINFDERRSSPFEGPNNQLVAHRTAPPPPLARQNSSKYRPELNKPRSKLSVHRKPVSSPTSTPVNLTDGDKSPAESVNLWEDAPTVEDSSDDDSDSGMWAKAPKTDAPSRPLLVVKTTMTESGDSLPLNTPVSAGHLPTSGSAVSGPLSATSEVDVLSSLPDWPARPTTEVLYDNIERFFPNADVDRPVIQMRSNRRREEAPSSPYTPTTPQTPTNPGSSQPTEFSRMKSIRVVAREASRRIKASPPNKQALLRRKSTKMWGQRVVEMRKGHSITLRDQKQYVWVKGELIGQGTFGKVFLALNMTTAEMMAVKQVEVPQSQAETQKYKSGMEALFAEVENMKDLDHLNIVQYLGFETLENVSSLFLEYVPGGSVKSILNHFGRFDEQLIRFLNRQVLDGLAYLHSKEILHRDLKADNLLLDIDGTIKISDFGISRRSRDIYSNNAEMSMQGTIFWMAPEVINNVVKNEKQGYSAKIDVWSLGCVILEMYAGRRPWSTEEAIGAMYKLGSSRQRPPIPEDTEEFVSDIGRKYLDDCFITDPSLRPTAIDLLSHSFSSEDPSFRFRDTEVGKALKHMSKKKVLGTHTESSP